MVKCLLREICELKKKILQINTVAKGSSVGRIMCDLYDVSADKGYEPYLAIGRGEVPEGKTGITIGNKGDFYRHVMRNFFMGEAGFGSAKVTKDLIRWILEIRPDIIHLHNIHGFYIQVEIFFDFLKKSNIPVVWTLHDCWSYTGHCAYYDYAACDKWKTGCNNCIHHAKVYPYALFKDNSENAYLRKRKAFTGVKNLKIVTPSSWLSEEVRKSFLKEYQVFVIPNGIDLNVFYPDDKGQKKDADGRKIVLGVANVWEHRKGLHYFERLCEDLSDDYLVRLVGLNDKKIKELKKKYGDKVDPMGKTANTEELRKIYASADVFVNATLEDNFPTTNLEALACGTPVVTYDTGGSGESVTKETGFVVRKPDYEALKIAIVKAANGAFDKNECRKRAEKYEKTKCYEKYMALYEKLI